MRTRPILDWSDSAPTISRGLCTKIEARSALPVHGNQKEAFLLLYVEGTNENEQRTILYPPAYGTAADPYRSILYSMPQAYVTERTDSDRCVDERESESDATVV